MLIDAADEPARLLELIGDGGLTTVVTTHQHWDHHRALAEVVQATGADVVAGEPDADAITEQTGVAVDQRVGEGDRIAVGTCSLVGDPGRRSHAGLDLPAVRRRVRPPAPVHRRLACSRVASGNTQGDPDRFAQLIDDVSTRSSTPLPDETWFYPGHGNDSTLGVERPHLDEWRERGW